MEIIEYLKKNKDKWFTTKELSNIYKGNRGCLIRKLSKIYESSWRNLFNIERKRQRVGINWTYLWRYHK